MKNGGNFFHFIDDEELSERAYAHSFTPYGKAEYLPDRSYAKEKTRAAVAYVTAALAILSIFIPLRTQTPRPAHPR